IMVSNRLPFSWNSHTEELQLSSGGLVTAISGIRSQKPISWVGIAPSGIDKQTFRNKLGSLSSKKKFIPLFVDEKLYDSYYNGMCNSVIWPLLHYESELADFKDDYWNAYSKV